MKNGNGLPIKGRQARPPDILNRTFQSAMEVLIREADVLKRIIDSIIVSARRMADPTH